MKDRKTILHTCQITCRWRVAAVRPRPTIPAQWQSVGSRLYQTLWLRAHHYYWWVAWVSLRLAYLEFVACYIAVEPTESVVICWRNRLGTRVCAALLCSKEITVFLGVKSGRNVPRFSSAANSVFRIDGSTNFPKILKHVKNSKCHTDDLKQVLYWGPKCIWHQPRDFSRPSDLLLEIWAPLISAKLYSITSPEYNPASSPKKAVFMFTAIQTKV